MLGRCWKATGWWGGTVLDLPSLDVFRSIPAIEDSSTPFFFFQSASSLRRGEEEEERPAGGEDSCGGGAIFPSFAFDHWGAAGGRAGGGRARSGGWRFTTRGRKRVERERGREKWEKSAEIFNATARLVAGALSFPVCAAPRRRWCGAAAAAPSVRVERNERTPERLRKLSPPFQFLGI